ncbi:ER degradation-enhancing alpha-mannosidase-like protein 2 [Lineus longissimus]|uniref:ER degradation-enhancing alpha-mannosidase-like protein 2 n=1 Tax=Lineus longissimus TaxID=88925 RepID=UPI002B4C7CCA
MKIFVFIVLAVSLCLHVETFREINKKDMKTYRDRVVKMFHHAYDGYMKHAYPYDELRPISCDGHDTWGSYSLTLIDALDTLAVMGNYSEFRKVADLVIENIEFDDDINVSVFETNIRVVGGLISAHLLSKKAGMLLEPGWPCSGPLLRMAESAARRLLPAFNTTTGMPYGTVNFRNGVPKGETTVTCTAGVGTFIVEFGALSKLTGDPVFEFVAMRALKALWDHKTDIGLVGNHIDVNSGKWTAADMAIGAGVDSYLEYLVKGSILFQYPELILSYQEFLAKIEKYMKQDDWYLWVSSKKGSVTYPVFTSLDAYWPGILSLVGNIDKAMKTIHNYHQVWKQFGFTPEFYNIGKAEAVNKREGYPLRPELIESAMYLYQATKDPYLLEIGVDILESIEHSTKTNCGYATVKDVRSHMLENRMESFFLAETTKYLYLLFDTENFIHNTGGKGEVIETPNGECIINAGGYVFNTEAHPIDAAALYCCSAEKTESDNILQEFHENLDLMSVLGLRSDKKGNTFEAKKTTKDFSSRESDEKQTEKTSEKHPETKKSVDSKNSSDDSKNANATNEESLNNFKNGPEIEVNVSTGTNEEISSGEDEGSGDGGDGSDTELDDKQKLIIQLQKAAKQAADAKVLQVVVPSSGASSTDTKGSENGTNEQDGAGSAKGPERPVVQDKEVPYDGSILTCPAQPFHSRLSLLGELWEDS